MSQPLNFFAFGECMAQLNIDTQQHVDLGFAGDVFNALVYAKRCFDHVNPIFVSATGTDKLSQLMHKTSLDENIDTSKIVRSESHNLGIYSINIDDQGERSFDYWRSNSAASQYFSLSASKSKPFDIDLDANASNVFFFSGISIGILSETDRNELLTAISQLKAQGCRIVFDPNYRPKLWDSQQQAISWINRAYQISDIVLPGLDEHEMLFGHKTVQDVYEYFEQWHSKEIVVKAGSEGVYARDEAQNSIHVPFKAAEVQVDSTAAGDSFAGVYISSRLQGKDMEESVQLASTVARFVVTQYGAITDKNSFETFKQQL